MIAQQQSTGKNGLLYYRVRNVENAGISEILPGLYIGGICALKATTMKEYGITVIINTTSEVPNSSSLGNMSRMKLWLEDNPEVWVLSYLDFVCSKILKTIARGGKVLIHSVQGESRCATICLAFLTKYKFKTLRDAYMYLASIRPKVEPNIGFWRQLISFEQELKQNVGSVRIVRDQDDPSILVPDVYRKFALRRQELRKFQNQTATYTQELSELAEVSQPVNQLDQKNNSGQLNPATSVLATVTEIAGDVAIADIGTTTELVSRPAWNPKLRISSRMNSSIRKFRPVLEPLAEVTEAAMQR